MLLSNHIREIFPRSGDPPVAEDEDDEREPETPEEYDYSGGVRGKYAARFARGGQVVVLDPDVAQVFSDSESINRALRALAEDHSRSIREDVSVNLLRFDLNIAETLCQIANISAQLNNVFTEHAYLSFDITKA